MKRSGGGRSPTSSSGVLNRKVLSRRLQSCQQTYSTVDEIVEHLRTNYPDYKCTKQQPFTRAVQQALQFSSNYTQKPSPSPSNFNFDADSDEHEHAMEASSRKKRRSNDTEQRLQALEDLHIVRRRNQHRGSSSSSGTGSSSSSSEEEDEAVSSSKDAIYGKKEEPKFDLMKTMLRKGYNQSNNTKSEFEEKNIEMEVVTNKTKDKISMANQGGTTKKDAKASVTTATGADGMKVDGKDAPRFRDLGGMERVLELKMEVIVPLYHPHLPRWLGVCPMAGILLHGPLGCGKTKLAHSIANATGVPFYKISATEVVSGVSGASEENIRDLFSKAYRTAPSTVFIDEIDAIAS